MDKASRFRDLVILVVVFTSSLTYAQKPRARDIGIPFEGTPGANNAITDVKGVEVGYSTIISGSGKNPRQRAGAYGRDGDIS